MEIKKFEFEGNEITFLTGDDIMINATEMAKPFDVKPAFWLRIDQSTKLIETLGRVHNCTLDELVRIVGDGNPKNRGTWFHQDVAIAFAHWLSPEFYIWCNDRIKELFKYGITALKEENREKIFTLSQFANKVMEDHPHERKYKIYEDLRQRGFLDIHNKPFQKWVEKGLFKYMLYRDDEYPKYPVVTEEGFNWITRLLFPQSGNNPLLEAKLDLLLRSNESIMERLLITSSSSSEEQKRVNLENMRSLCSQIKNLWDGNPILDIPETITPTFKLDKY